jgi:hypothetical protein
MHYCMSTFEGWPFLGFYAMQCVKSTLMMTVTVSFETSVEFCQNAQRRISDDRQLHRHCIEKLKSHVSFS